jgi:hypothetical protein
VELILSRFLRRNRSERLAAELELMIIARAAAPLNLGTTLACY